MIEKAIFLYKTALLEVNVNTNSMESIKWNYHKERRFASNYFIYLKILFQYIRTSYSRFDVPTTQMSIFLLFVSDGVLLEGDFSL